MLTIDRATVLTPHRWLQRQRVQLVGDRIESIEPSGGGIESGETVIDAKGLFLAPGFIDLQINGGFGTDFTAHPDRIWDVAERLPRWGVTTFLPTIVTSPSSKIDRARETLASGPPPDFAGARPLGLHVEGPFLNPTRKGAHNPDFLQAVAPDLCDDFSPEKHVRLVTLAPELPGALELVRLLAEKDVVVSAGHTGATYEEAREAFGEGVRYGTHIFNAMAPYHQHEPGIVGALLDDDRVHFGLIADGIHVHPAVIRMIWSTAGRRLTLVTDAMAALGAEPGVYELGDKTVEVDETSARLLDGTLAGSILSLDEALRNLLAFTDCGIREALSTITKRPAALLGMDGEIGRIEAGRRADLVLLTPAMEVVLTIAGGQIVYRSEKLNSALL
jgi:N-acetylglucosamine-6-phosphate deacetylase